jgi:hypothetical protein
MMGQWDVIVIDTGGKDWLIAVAARGEIAAVEQGKFYFKRMVPGGTIAKITATRRPTHG